MSEKLGPGETENLRMKLDKRLHYFMVGKNLAKVVDLLGAHEFCDYDDKDKSKIVKFRAKEFIDYLIQTGDTEIFGNDSSDHLPDRPTATSSKQSADSKFSTRSEFAPADWMNAEEIEAYLKQFNPKISRRTLMTWIREMEPLDPRDHGMLNKHKNIPSMCYSNKIVEKLKERVLAQKQSENWLTREELIKKLTSEKNLNASDQTVTNAIQELGLIYGHDYEDRQDKMDRKKPHYSEYVEGLVRKLLKERGERAPEGWRPLNTMIIKLKEKNPTKLRQDNDYRKRVTHYIAGLNLTADQDFKMYLNHRNQPILHYSPAVVDLVEKFLISQEDK